MNFDRLRRRTALGRLRHALDSERLRRATDLGRLRQVADAARLRRAADFERLRRAADFERLRQAADFERLRRVADDFDWARVGLENPVTRRRLLRAAPGVAGAVLLAGVAVAEASSQAPRVTTRPRAAASPRHPIEKATLAPVVAQRKPIYTLREYRRLVPGPAFPSDAIALTIDDGPHPVWTPKILALLEKYHVPALFCMIGNQVLGHEGVARSVVQAGHQLANHTWSHPTTLAHKPATSVHSEIHRAQEKIYNTTGVAPRLFRSPGGAWSTTVFNEVAKSGLVPLDWSDDPRDWAKPGTTAITHRMLACRPGQILLCHDGGGDRSQTYAALRKVIPALSARGYRFVAL